jgi:hypothetical protein
VTPQQRAERTRSLKLAVTIRAQQLEPEGRSHEAAALVVPVWAHENGKCEEPTIPSLAKAAGVDRSLLWRLLMCKYPALPTRERLEEYLELTPSTPGAMSEVLSVVEKLKGVDG